MQEQQADTQRLAGYAHMNPPPEFPTKLARPLGWLKDRLFGAKPTKRAPGDGIVHTAASNPTAAFAEKDAVAQALRLLGAPDHMKHVDRYAAHVAQFVKDNPDHDVVKSYKDKAGVIGGTAGPELVQAVKPLVGAVNLLLSAHGLDQRFQKPVSAALPTHPPAVHTATGGPGYEVVEDTPLAPEPEAAPTEDRHAAVLRMTRANASTEDILQHLQDVHGAKDRKTAQAWRRASLNRALAMHRKTQGPTKLAAPKPGETIKPKHLIGRAYKDEYTQKGVRIHPLLAGTALAFHLRQIGGVDADRALAWTAHSTRRDADPFAHLGRVLKAQNHPLANAYNWDTMEKNLLQDAHVNEFIRRHVQNPEGLSEHQFWDRVYRQFGKGTHSRTADLQKRFANEFGSRIKWEDAVDSIHRQADRELDREYIKQTHDEPEGDPLHWRGVMGAVPTAEHAKLERCYGDSE